MFISMPIAFQNQKIARWIAVFVIAIVGFVPASHSHELRPAVLDITLGGAEEAQVTAELNFIAEGFLAEIDLSAVTDTDESQNAARYDQIRALASDQMARLLRQKWPELTTLMALYSQEQPLELRLDDIQVEQQENLALVRETRVIFSASLPADSVAVTVRWDRQLGSILLRSLADEQEADYSEFMVMGGTSKPIMLADGVPQPVQDTITTYLYSGIVHIIPYGLDHMLFVLALLATSISFRPLLLQISLFTIAHTITLALASLKVLSFSVPLVETLIAASIAYVGIENLRKTDQSVGWLRAGVIFCFGLLHGMGFATVLQDFGLPQSAFAIGLISFNIGVEIGQILTIAPIWLLVSWLALSGRQFRYGFQIPVSVVILAISLFWIYERLPGIFA